MARVAILGSTGSIGTQTLQVLEHLKGFEVFALTAHKSVQSLGEQLERWHPKMAAVATQEDAQFLAGKYSLPVGYGEEGLCEIATHPAVDIVVVAIVGSAGLVPTLAALKAGKRVALANKETLVAAGHLVMEYREQIIPIDSEHSAIWQCLEGKNRANLAKVILTASGGPFHSYSGDLSQVTVEQALRHPNWDMGGKITIDSATLMNKGLEVIEAHWLFNVDYSAIEVVVHPQSLIHSMVQFVDGSLLAQMATTDMRLPIQYALTYPEMEKSQVAKLNLWELPPLTFARPDLERFPCLALAYRAGEIGGTMPVVLNAANEVAVDAFIQKRIRFTDIPELVAQVMEEHTPISQPSLEEILAADAEAREIAGTLSLQLYKEDAKV